jgi:hypothetical protein
MSLLHHYWQIYPAMSGHNCICVATALLETGMVAMETPVTQFQLEAPCGPVNITAHCRSGKVLSRLESLQALGQSLCMGKVKALENHLSILAQRKGVGIWPTNIFHYSTASEAANLGAVSI